MFQYTVFWDGMDWCAKFSELLISSRLSRKRKKKKDRQMNKRKRGKKKKQKENSKGVKEEKILAVPEVIIWSQKYTNLSFACCAIIFSSD